MYTHIIRYMHILCLFPIDNISRGSSVFLWLKTSPPRQSYRPAHDAATRSLELDPKNMKAIRAGRWICASKLLGSPGISWDLLGNSVCIWHCIILDVCGAVWYCVFSLEEYFLAGSVAFGRQSFHQMIAGDRDRQRLGKVLLKSNGHCCTWWF